MKTMWILRLGGLMKAMDFDKNVDEAVRREEGGFFISRDTEFDNTVDARASFKDNHEGWVYVERKNDQR